MRDLQARMLSAILDGEGLAGVAELAALEAGGPVAILLPARGLAASSNGEPPAGLGDYTRARIEGGNAEPPEAVDAEELVSVGEEAVGAVFLLGSSESDGPKVAIDSSEVLQAAALACIAELAVHEARDEVTESLRGTLLEDLRRGGLEGAEAVRRGARLGCELGRGAVALVAEVRSSQPRLAAALVASDYPGAIAEPLEGGRVYALLPARGDDDAPQLTAAEARKVVRRLRSHGPAASSSFYPDPAELHHAVREAELVLDVVAHDERMAERLESELDDGVYRLLFRALVGNPEEVVSFYEDTVEPVVRYDRRYSSDLLGTLEAFLAHDCNMSATARAIYTHRHTVGYRLRRVRELSDLDPAVGDDRERLGLGVKAFHILAPTLPR